MGHPHEKDRPVKLLLIHSSKAAMQAIDQYYRQRLNGWSLIHRYDSQLMAALADGEETLSRNIIDAHIKTNVKEQAIDTVMITCSAVTLEQMRLLNQNSPVPVFKVDVPMMEKALLAGGRLGLVATFVPGGEASEALLLRLAHERNLSPAIVRIFVPEAYPALQAGDVEEHDRLVLRAIAGHINDIDAVILSQVSMAHLHEPAEKAFHKRIFSSLQDSAGMLLEQYQK